MSRLVLFNKPFGVLSQFTSDGHHPGLADFLPIKGVYAAGRLDHDSEGLLLLTDDGRWQQRIADPAHKLPKTYWVQVEDVPDDEALAALRRGIELRDGRTRPAEVRRMAEPALWPRDPPIRQRRHIPTCWLALRLREGRNRQVRRMTAAAGHPTLRLVRHAIGDWDLGDLAPGEWRELALPPLPANTPRRKPASVRQTGKPQRSTGKPRRDGRQSR